MTKKPRNEKHAAQNVRVKKLLEDIKQSRRDFLREILSRQKLLSILHEQIEAQPPKDPLIAGIEESWDRLSTHYHKVRRRFQRRYGRPPAREPASYQPSGSKFDPDHWKNEWQYERLDGNRGFLAISNAFNILVALRNAPELSGLIATDLNTGKIMLKGPIPLTHDPTFDEDFEMRPLLVADVTAIREYLQFIGLTKATQEDVAAAIKLVAVENAWRPEL